MQTYLDKIIADHRELAGSDTRKTSDLISIARDMPPCLGFKKSLEGAGVSIIAEIKRRSPSRGALNAELDPVAQAKTYELNGASCISVLTDEKYFAGSLDDLRLVKNSTRVPILRKDFTVCENDVLDARVNGADAILLIVSALSQQELVELQGLARDVDLDVLVEVHDESELDRAKLVGADLVGVNQRDLYTFEVDSNKALVMAELFEPEAVKVCESGISSPTQISALARAGYNAALVGETLVRSMDPGRTLSELLRAGRGDF